MQSLHRINQCFGTFDDAKFQETTLDNTWRLWVFQVCTEWGYFSVRISSMYSYVRPSHEIYRLHLRLGTLVLFPNF